jgi:ABC-2 type transport system permease protein
MQKYLQLVKISFQEFFVYRLNFILWRFRVVISLLTTFIFWLVIYGNRTEILGYQKAQMLTYVVGIALLRGLILMSRSSDLGGEIRSGELTKIITRPMNFFAFWLSRDIADKSLTISFTIFEIIGILLIFHFPFYIPKSLTTMLLFIIFLVLAFFLYFFISMIISLVAFWTEEVWATRFLIDLIFLEFFAGSYFPIDILPKWLSGIIYMTPFPYMIFFPMKIWLEQLPTVTAIKSIIICLIWLLISIKVTSYLWKKGMKTYGAYGG